MISWKAIWLLSRPSPAGHGRTSSPLAEEGLEQRREVDNNLRYDPAATFCELTVTNPVKPLIFLASCGSWLCKPRQSGLNPATQAQPQHTICDGMRGGG